MWRQMPRISRPCRPFPFLAPPSGCFGVRLRSIPRHIVIGRKPLPAAPPTPATRPQVRIAGCICGSDASFANSPHCPLRAPAAESAAILDSAGLPIALPVGLGTLHCCLFAPVAQTPANEQHHAVNDSRLPTTRRCGVSGFLIRRSLCHRQTSAAPCGELGRHGYSPSSRKSRSV